MLKSGNEPLKQVKNKYSHLLTSEISYRSFEHQTRLTNPYQLQNDEYAELELANTEKFYKQLNFEKTILRIDNIRDSFCKIEDDLVKAFYIFQLTSSSDEVFIVGKKFNVIENFFEYPAESGMVGFYRARNFSSEFVKYNITTHAEKYYVVGLNTTCIPLVTSGFSLVLTSSSGHQWFTGSFLLVVYNYYKLTTCN